LHAYRKVTQCLDRRIDDAILLGSEVNAWQAARNAIDSKINWQFTTDGARTKLRRLYPEYLRRDAKEPLPVPTHVYN
jgi:ribosomal protein S13